MSVRIRAFRQTDVGAAFAMSRALGWPHRIEDWRWLGSLATGYVALLGGAVVGTTLRWDYDRSVSSVGAVMVDPDCQSMGIGRALMEACLAAMGERTIVLYATPAGQRLYDHLGFDTHGTTTQHQGPVSALAGISGRSIKDPGIALVPLEPGLIDIAIRLAEQGSGLVRGEFLASLIAISEGVLLTDRDRPVGFSLLRRYGRGWAIGPVVASDDRHAKSLISHWLSRTIGAFVRIDLTADAGIAVRRLVATAGLAAASEATAMVRGRWPEGAAAVRQFALVSQATG